MKNPKVSIVGAGLVGSLFSCFLARRGYTVDVFERRQDMRKANISAGKSINLAMSTRGWTALEKAGLRELMEPMAIAMHSRMIHQEDGSIDVQAYGKEGEAIYSISRGDLNKIMMEVAEKEPNVNFHFNKKCIDVDFEDYSALYNIVYCFDMEKEHEQAIKYLNSYIDKNPYCEVAWHQIGRQYFIIDKFKEALRAFDYAVLIDEHFIGGYLEKAKTLEELGEYQEAIDNYLITLDLDDPTAFAFVRIGECYEKLHKYDAAISYYKKAVHEDPLLDRGWVLLTNLYFNEENYQKASYYISKALKIDDSNTVYWRRYAEIQLKLNFFEEAVTGFKHCLSLNDDALEIYIGLADVLSFLGEFKDAVSILFEAQKSYKNFAEIEYRLAGLFFILNKEKYGFHHLITAMKVDYDYHIIINELFPTVYDNKKVQKLISDYKKTFE